MTKANNETVWISDALGSVRLWCKFTHMIDGVLGGGWAKELPREQIGYWEKIMSRHKNGFHLAEHERPKEFAPNPGHDVPADKVLPDLFSCNASGFIIVSERCANILRQFDLGEGTLDPVTFYRKDRKTALPGHYYLLNFGCHKEVVLPELSHPRRIGRIEDLEPPVWLASSVEDSDCAVSRAALAGPDLWTDPRVINALFLSNRLVQALKAEKLAGKFMLSQCRLVETSGNAA